MRRLARVQIKGLLGRFDHDIELPEDWEFVILHGPNGVGKTRFLEIISNTFRFRANVLLGMPFEQASFGFSDGTTLEVVKGNQGQLPLPDSSDDNEPTGRGVDSLTYRLFADADEPIRWTLHRDTVSSLDSRRVRDLERFLPVEQVGPDVWQDQRQGDFVSLAELVDRYGDEIPFEPVLSRQEVPAELKTFLDDASVHLIETQRLLTFDARAMRQRANPGRRHAPQKLTVQEFAEDLTRRIGDALARNSRTFQELDRTFPRRVLGGAVPSDITDQQVQERYDAQSDLRRRLAEISVLDRSDEMPLPHRALHDWERRVLWTYLDDSEQKLSTFQTLLDRVRLLREIVNSRFLFKELVIDADRGFRFETESGEEVGPNQLSSGEQHELVLLYDLLFNVGANSLVLVDEPEISLHVGWQQQFLNDIQRIASLADLQFIVATHSPQIIHTWWDRSIALYTPPDSDAMDLAR